ncbi:unnamed protein product [Schistocephalus solidus]|uniref:NKAP-like protein n=2 Tax=Schistocephalus solidus TaxID=70667 RepID=A0A0V0J7M9_SCHSO|nr:unnamed protein product [Schistocephalus solidus]
MTRCKYFEIHFISSECYLLLRNFVECTWTHSGCIFICLHYFFEVLTFPLSYRFVMSETRHRHSERSRSPFDDGISKNSKKCSREGKSDHNHWDGRRDRRSSPFDGEFRRPYTADEQIDMDEKYKPRYKPFEVGHQTPEFWEHRRQNREKAGALFNEKLWASPPSRSFSEDEGNTEVAVVEGPDPVPIHSLSRDLSDSRKTKKSKSHKKSGERKKSNTRSHHHHHHHNKKHKKSKKHRPKPSSSSSSESSSNEEDEQKLFIRQMKAKKLELERLRAEEEEATALIGPVLPGGESSAAVPLDYGKALLPGEGAAMAAYIAEGKRIPRRGEIGLTSEEIEKFEQAGYVMSGSRHRRMEAVRLRKENQIYSADEKRALENFNHAERAKREAKLQALFKALIKKKLEDKQSSSSSANR